MKEIQTLLSVENLPYLYQSDFYNIGFNKKGFYLDGNGNQYDYSIPESNYLSIIEDEDYKLSTVPDQDDNDAEDAKTDFVYDNVIKPSELFNKLQLCEVTKSDLRMELSNEMIEDLTSAPVLELESFIMDSGWRTKSILIYIAELDVYKQTILSESGNSERRNQSKYTSEILEMFNEL